MQDLYWDLKNLSKEMFPSGVIDFAPTDRILFYNTDLDYFVHKDFPGFNLYNLQLILRELDIPNFICAVQSNMPESDRYTRMVRDILRPEDVPMRAISASPEIFAAAGLPKHKDINHKAIEAPFVILSRLGRFHRTLFMCQLFNENLHTRGLVAYHNIGVAKDRARLTESSRSYADCPINGHFLTTYPFAHSNNEYNISVPVRQLVNNFMISTTNYCNFAEREEISNKLVSQTYQQDPIQNALVYVALETTVHYPTPFQSAISFKSIGQKRPFVIFGSPGCLKLLKDQGFQTFDRWWNEDYDLEVNIEFRIKKIIEIMRDLSDLSVLQLKDLCKEMEPVLEYNYQHFTGRFVSDGQAVINAVLDQSIIHHD